MRQRLLALLVAAPLVCVLLLAPTMADASILYCVAGGSTSTTACTPSSPTPVSNTFSPSGGTASAVAGLTSNPVSLGATANAIGTEFVNGDAKATAGFSGYQVTFSGPSAGATTTSLNLSLSGSLAFATGGPEMWGFSDVRVATVLSGSQGSVTGNGDMGTSVQPQPGPFPGPPSYTTSSGGMLSGKLPFGTVTFSTPTLSIVNGDTVLLAMSLTVDASCFDPVACTASGDYLNTLKFVQDVPVFNLPSGWTANSADGSIVNNMLVAIPEPGTGVLVMTGLLGLAARRRRRG